MLGYSFFILFLLTPHLLEGWGTTRTELCERCNTAYETCRESTFNTVERCAGLYRICVGTRRCSPLGGFDRKYSFDPTEAPSKVPTVNPTERKEPKINDILDLPEQDVLIQVNETNDDGNNIVVGNYTLRNNTKWLDLENILKCVPEYERSKTSDALVLAPTSYILFSYSQSILDIEIDEILLLNKFIVINDLGLPKNCSFMPATKVVNIDIDFLANNIKIFVIDAQFSEYFTSFNVNVSNYIGENAEEAVFRQTTPKIPVNQKITTTNGIEDVQYSNLAYTLNQIVCVDPDLLVNNEVDPSLCNQSFITQFGTKLGKEFFKSNVDITNRRRLKFWKWLKKAVTTVVDVVVDVVEVIVQIVTGNIDQRFGLGVFIDKSVSYELSGTQTRTFNSGNGEVSLSGTFNIDAGVLFEFGISLNLIIQYSLFDKNPSFDYFKMSVSGGTIFDAYANVDLSGSINLDYTFAEIDRRKTVWIGPVPIIITVGASFTFGLEASSEFSLSSNAGYERIGAEFGVEWSPSTGWQEISDFNFDLVTYFTYGADQINDDGNCLLFGIEPSFTVELFITFYEIVTAAVPITISSPGTVSCPASCNNNIHPCDINPKQLKLDYQILVTGELEFRVEVEKFGFDPIAISFPLFEFSLFQGDKCVNYNIPALEASCCPTESPTLFPTLSPTKTPTISPSTSPSKSPTKSPTRLTRHPTQTTSTPTAKPTSVFTQRCLNIIQAKDGFTDYGFYWDLINEARCWDGTYIQSTFSCTDFGDFYVYIKDNCGSAFTQTITPIMAESVIMYNEELCLDYSGPNCGDITIELREDDIETFQLVQSFILNPLLNQQQNVGGITFTYIQK